MVLVDRIKQVLGESYYSLDPKIEAHAWREIVLSDSQVVVCDDVAPLLAVRFEHLIKLKNRRYWTIPVWTTLYEWNREQYCNTVYAMVSDVGPMLKSNPRIKESASISKQESKRRRKYAQLLKAQLAKKRAAEKTKALEKEFLKVISGGAPQYKKPTSTKLKKNTFGFGDAKLEKFAKASQGKTGLSLRLCEWNNKIKDGKPISKCFNESGYFWNYPCGLKVKHTLRKKKGLCQQHDIFGDVESTKLGKYVFVLDAKENLQRKIITKEVRVHNGDDGHQFRHYGGFEVVDGEEYVSGTPIWDKEGRVISVISWSWMQDRVESYMVGPTKIGDTTCFKETWELYYHSTQTPVQRMKKEQMQAVRAQCNAVATAAKLESLTKEMQNLKVIANQTAEVVPAAMSNQNFPVVRKRKGRKNKKNTWFMSAAIIALYVLVVNATHREKSITVKDCKYDMYFLSDGCIQARGAVVNSSFWSGSTGMTTMHSVCGVEGDEISVSIIKGELHYSTDVVWVYGVKCLNDFGDIKRYTNSVEIHMQFKEIVRCRVQNLHHYIDHLGTTHTSWSRREMIFHGLVKYQLYFREHGMIECDWSKLKSFKALTEINQIGVAGANPVESAEVDTITETTTRAKRAALYDESATAELCAGVHMAERERCLTQVAAIDSEQKKEDYLKSIIAKAKKHEFHTVDCARTWDMVMYLIRGFGVMPEELGNLRSFEAECIVLRSCRKQCSRLVKGGNGENCNDMDLVDCQSAVTKRRNKIKDLMVQTSHFNEQDPESVQYGCTEWDGWRSAGWLRGSLNETCAKSKGTRVCGDLSCVSVKKLIKHRVCEKKDYDSAVTDFSYDGKSTLGGFYGHHGTTETTTTSTQHVRHDVNEYDTVGCFDRKFLFMVFNYQPACTSCIAPFEILWENGCFTKWEIGQKITSIKIFKDKTIFTVDGKETKCGNDYDFNACCNGKGPTESWEESNHVDKYCHCRIGALGFWSGIKHTFWRIYNMSTHPQMLLHIAVGFLISFYSRFFSITYLLIAILWVLPTTEAACSLDQMVMSDLAAELSEGRSYHVRVQKGQCLAVGDVTMEVLDVSVVYNYAFHKYIPYHLKMSCNYVDWGCKYGNADQVWTERSDCHEKCAGKRIVKKDHVASFTGDGCLFGGSINVRIDACFMLGGADTFMALYDRITTDPTIVVRYREHFGGVTKDREYTSGVDNTLVKMFDVSTSTKVAPRMLGHRLGHNYCANGIIETHGVCSSSDFADPMHFKIDCVNLDYSWKTSKKLFDLKWDKKDFENALIDYFEPCGSFIKTSLTGDGMNVSIPANWFEATVVTKHMVMATSVDKCDQSKIVVNSKPGISGYHSSTVIDFTSTADKKCRIAAKVEGCMSTDGTLLVLSPNNKMSISYWCYYNATGKVRIVGKSERIIDVSIVKNYFPHNTRASNWVYSTYDAVSLSSFRVGLAKFWQNLKWPDWFSSIGEFMEKGFWKVLISGLILLPLTVSVLYGNIFAGIFWGFMFWLIALTDYVLAEDVIVRLPVSSGAYVAAAFVKYGISFVVWLFGVWIDMGVKQMVTMANWLIWVIILCLSAEIGMGPIVVGWSWLFGMQIMSYVGYRSELQNTESLYCMPFVNWIVTKSLFVERKAEDLEDCYNVSTKHNNEGQKREVKRILFCSKGQITEQEAKYELKEGFNIKNIKGVCWVLGYRDGDAKTWWVSKHCLEGHDAQSYGSQVLGTGTCPNMRFSMGFEDFKPVPGNSGWIVENGSGVWQFEGIRPESNELHWAHLFECPQGVKPNEVVSVEWDSNDKKLNFIDMALSSSTYDVEEGFVSDAKGIIVGKNGFWRTSTTGPLVSPGGQLKIGGHTHYLGTIFGRHYKYGDADMYEISGKHYPVAIRSGHVNTFWKENLSGRDGDMDFKTIGTKYCCRNYSVISILDAKDGETTCGKGERVITYDESKGLLRTVFRIGEANKYESGSAVFSFMARKLLGIVSFSDDTYQYAVGPFSDYLSVEKKLKINADPFSGYGNGPATSMRVKDMLTGCVVTFVNSQNKIVRKYSSPYYYREIRDVVLNSNLAIRTPVDEIRLGGYLLDSKEVETELIEKLGLEDGSCEEVQNFRYTAYKNMGQNSQHQDDRSVPLFVQVSNVAVTPDIRLVIGNKPEFNLKETEQELEVQLKKYPEAVVIGVSYQGGTHEAIHEMIPKLRLPNKVICRLQFTLDMQGVCEALQASLYNRMHFVVFEDNENCFDEDKCRGKFKLDDDWSLVTPMNGSNVDLDNPSGTERMTYETFKSHCDGNFQTGILSNACNMGSFSLNSDGRLVTQHHVTFGNEISLTFKHLATYDFDKACYLSADADLAVYNGKPDFAKVELGKIYIAFNPCLSVGIFLKAGMESNLANRGGTNFFKMVPVQRVGKTWVEYESDGFYGLSGSPIINSQGEQVGVYGLAKYETVGICKTLVTHTPNVTLHQKIVGYFKNCAENYVSKAWPQNADHAYLQCPTGIGKSTTFILEIALIAKGKIVVLQPNRVACINAFERVKSLCIQGKVLLKKRMSVVLRLGKVGGNDDDRYGLDICDTEIIFATYGYGVSNKTLLTTADYLVLDECHKTDDSNVTGVILFGIMHLACKGVKLLMCSASMKPLETGFDCANNDTVSNTRYKVEILNYNSKSSVNDDEIIFQKDLVRTDMQSDVAINKAYLLNKCVLFFCATTKECERCRDYVLSKKFTDSSIAIYSGCTVGLNSITSTTWIFATNVVEQSVTIPEVDVVVDFGVEMKPVMQLNRNPFSYEKTISLRRIDASSAEQRKGRIGRTKPGIYISKGECSTAKPGIVSDIDPLGLLIAHSLGATSDQMEKYCNGLFRESLDKMSWILPYKILGEKGYEAYMAECGTIRFENNYGNKWNHVSKCDGDRMFLYLRCCTIDEKNAEEVNAMVKARANDSNDWWKNYVFFVTIVEQKRMEEIARKFKVASFEESGPTEPSSDFAIPSAFLTELAEFEGGEIRHSLLFGGVMTGVIATATIFGITSAITIVLNKKGGRKVVKMMSMSKDEVAGVGLKCANNYMINKKIVDASSTWLSRIRNKFTSVWSKAVDGVCKVDPELKEQSLELLWAQISTWVLGIAGTVGATMGVAAWPTLSVAIGATTLGAMYNRLCATVGNEFAFVLIGVIEAFVVYSFGAMFGMAALGTALITKLVKDLCFGTDSVKESWKYEKNDSYTRFLLAGSVGVGVGALLKYGTVGTSTSALIMTTLAPYAAPPSVGSSAGNVVILIHHVYEIFMHDISGTNVWHKRAQYGSLILSSFMAASRTSWVALAVGLIGAVLAGVCRQLLAFALEKGHLTFGKSLIKAEDKKARMDEFDASIRTVLALMAIAADPLSIITMVCEAIFAYYMSDPHPWKSALAYAGVSPIIGLLDLVLKFCSVLITATVPGQINQSARTSGNLLEMLNSVFTDLWASITNFFQEQKEDVTEQSMFCQAWRTIRETYDRFVLWLKSVMSSISKSFTSALDTLVKQSAASAIEEAKTKIPLMRMFVTGDTFQDDRATVERGTVADEFQVSRWAEQEFRLKGSDSCFLGLNIGCMESDNSSNLSFGGPLRLNAGCVGTVKNVSLQMFKMNNGAILEALLERNFDVKEAMGVLQVNGCIGKTEVKCGCGIDHGIISLKSSFLEVVILLTQKGEDVACFVCSSISGLSIIEKVVAMMMPGCELTENTELVEAAYDQYGYKTVRHSSSILDMACASFSAVSNVLKNNSMKDVMNCRQAAEECNLAFDWVLFQEEVMADSLLNNRKFEANWYRNISVEYITRGVDRMLPLNNEIVLKLNSLKFIELGSSNTVLKLSRFGSVFWLVPGNNAERNRKAVCKNGKMTYVKKRKDGYYVWSQMAKYPAILLHDEEKETYSFWAKEYVPSSGVVEKTSNLFKSLRGEMKCKLMKNSIEVLEIAEKPILDTSVKRVPSSSVEKFVNWRYGRTLDGKSYTVEPKDVPAFDWVTQSSKTFGSWLASLFTTDDDLSAYDKLSKTPLFKALNMHGVNVECPEDDEGDVYLDAVEELLANPRWTCGFDRATKGKVEMTWYPSDGTRLRSDCPRPLSVMKLYSEVNNLGRRISKTKFESLKSLERYVLPKRHYKDDQGNYVETASRGINKFKQLQEMTDVFDNCNNILDPTVGRGGFAHGASIIYKKHKPKNYYCSTLMETGHRWPDWDAMSVDQSNVRVIKLCEPGTVGKGNIKDRRFREHLYKNLRGVNLDLLVFDVGEYKSEDLKQYKYWTEAPDGQTSCSLIQAMKHLVEYMPDGSKLLFKFTGVFNGFNEVIANLLVHYKKVRVVKLGTSSLFSTEYYVICNGKCPEGRGLTIEQINVVCSQICAMVQDHLFRARQLLKASNRVRVNPIYRSDWLQPDARGYVYQNVGEGEYPKGMKVAVKNEVFGTFEETFLPNWDDRLSKMDRYFKQKCDFRRNMVKAKRLGLDQLCEIGFYPIKINKNNEKHQKNALLADFSKFVFGTDDDNSTYGQTQSTEKFKNASIQKRLNVNAGDLNEGVFCELIKIMSLMYTEYAKSIFTKCKLSGPNEVLIMLNKNGRSGMFSKYPNLREYVNAHSKLINGVPEWYKIAYDKCIIPWSKGENSHCYISVMHKNEPKAKKNVVDGEVLLGLTDGELSDYNSLGHRFIQFADEISRVAHYIVLGDVLSKANNTKLYKGTINGTPPHVVGRIVRALWDSNETEERKVVVEGNNPSLDLVVETFKKRESAEVPAACIMDYSSWDCTVTKQERYGEYVFFRPFFEKKHHMLLKTMMSELCYAICIDNEANVWLRDGQRGSGELTTSFGNTALVVANTYRMIGKTLGIKVEELLETHSTIEVKIGEKAKKFEICKVPLVADGDDVVIFGDHDKLMHMAKLMQEVLTEQNKIVRSGTSAGCTIVSNFEQVSFCSYTYEPVLVGKDARNISVSDYVKERVWDSKFKIWYLPSRISSDIIGRFRLTLKRQAQTWDPEDVSDEGCVALTRSKVISYLLLYPHNRVVRYMCISLLSVMGDGPMTWYDQKTTWNGVVLGATTTLGAIESLYGVKTFDDIGYCQYKKEIRDLKKIRNNSKLTCSSCPIRMEQLVNRMLKWLKHYGIKEPRVFCWDGKMKKYCDQYFEVENMWVKAVAVDSRPRYELKI